MNNKSTRFIFITGGVVSSLGKGLVAASAGALLQSRGFSVRIRKFDPYLNIDPGTMSPTQHGEVFVTEDGAETDLDLGHYERFTGVNATRNDNITTGRVYDSLLKKERKGDYLGQTVQVIPHVTDLIKAFVFHDSDSVDFMICEIGGTVGDIESQACLEAIRQIGYSYKDNTIFIHLTLLPYLESANEFKTKPTQHSVKELNSVGIQPNIIICRCKQLISQEQRQKVASFCNVTPENVISGVDVHSIYQVPISSYENGLDMQILKHFALESSEMPNLDPWLGIIDAINNPVNGEVTVAIVGKYIKLRDAYKSLIEALDHAAIHHKVRLKINWVNARTLVDDLALSTADAIIIPGGFGNDGIEGKLATIHYARTNKIPFLGICMGMQLAVLEFASNIVKLEDANSVEYDPECKNPVVELMGSWVSVNSQEMKGSAEHLGGSLRVGSYKCLLKNGSKVADIYGNSVIEERRRHRYGINPKYEKVIEEHGAVFSGRSEDGNLVEIMELPDHPWFVAVQYHPEFKSRPFAPHPLFLSMINCVIQRKHGN